MARADVHAPAGPVDGERHLADLLEGFGGVLEPGRDLPVFGVCPDDRLDVMVEHSEPAVVPLQHPPFMPVGHRPGLGLGWLRGEGRATFVESRPVSGDADLAEGWRIGDRVELEVVDVAVELERDHPVHEPARGDAGLRGSLRV